MKDQEIWKIIKTKYHGSINPPSLMAQLLFDVAREVSDYTDSEIIQLLESRIYNLRKDVEVLENEVRRLKGEPEIWRPYA